MLMMSPFREHWRGEEKFKMSEDIRGVQVVIKRDEEIFLCKRGVSCAMPGTWGNVGGHVEIKSKEIPVAAMVREMKEEYGLIVLPRDLAVLGECTTTISDGLNSYLELIYLYKIIGNMEPTSCEPEKCVEGRWVIREDVSSTDLFEPTRIALEKFESQIWSTT